MTNLTRTIEQLKEAGLWIIGTDAGNTVGDQFDYMGRWLLLLAVKERISRLVRKL